MSFFRPHLCSFPKCSHVFSAFFRIELCQTWHESSELMMFLIWPSFGARFEDKGCDCSQEFENRV